LKAIRQEGLKRELNQPALDLHRLFRYKISIARFNAGKGPMNQNSNNHDLLSSWKEIADYLGCDERTCRRWELNFGLPIHRMEGTSKPRVYAYKRELDSWRTEKLNGGLTGHNRIKVRPGAARLGSKRSRLKLLWLVPASGAIIAAILFIVRLSPGEPADFNIKGSKLIILDQKGKKLWDFDTKLDSLISESEYREHYQTRGRSMMGKSILPYLAIKDINLCGRMEILFAPKRGSEYYETGLFCFDHGGKELWHYRPGRELRFGEHIYSADYRIFGVEPYDINHDENFEVFLIIAHQPHSPSGLVVLDCKGKVLGEFINWGRIDDIAYADFDEDGKIEVIIAGLNDEYGKGFLAVFDTTRIAGSSPQSEGYACQNCVPGSEKYYILFPRTDVDMVLHPEKEAIEEIHFLNNNRIELQTKISHIFFELDFGFQVQDVKGSDYFREQHQEQKSAGKITSILDDAYYEALKKGVLYWDGEQWTSAPSWNGNAVTAKQPEPQGPGLD
jgi:hypothetical protein